MSDSNKAVFLSYASQDAEAARRIADALRTVGVEVWFDQNELVGGDAWDRKIREQIGACALFVPVISANTQSRKEGYFRLEWKLAEDRSHLMAKGVPFIVPVSIDATPERGALVPDAFLAVQWTKLPGGETSPAFVARVQKLLGATSAAIPATTSSNPTPMATAPAAKSGLPSWVTIALGAAIFALVAYVLLRPATKETPAAAPEKPTIAEAKPTSVAPPGPVAPDPKSIAVLAFANLSAEKDNESFSDGLSENILDKLARNPALRVVARTSSFFYKGKSVPFPQIAQELHVGTIIEGSVQRAGNTIRVVAQLINATDGMHVWSETFDRELTTAGIFAIQDEIAQKIAARLAPNSAAAQSNGAAVPTKNLAAYEAFLRGREQQMKGAGGASEALGFFERATEIDPGFAIAWVQLARVHSGRYYNGLEDEDRGQALARAAIDQAQRLQPDLPDLHLASAAFRFYVENDLPSAIRELDLLARIRPEDGETLQLRGNIYLNLGRFSDSVEVCQRSVSLDPKNLLAWNNLGLSLAALSRYSEALAAYEHSVQISLVGGSAANRAGAIFRWKGDPKMAVESFRDTPLEKMTTGTVSNYINYLWMAGDHAKALELLDQVGWSGALAQNEYLFSYLVKARVREAIGDSEGARRDYLAALPQVERTRDAHPRSYRAYLPLAQVYAGLGRKDEALTAARRSVELMPPSHDPRIAANTSLRVLVDVEAHFGMFDEALDLVKQQIAAGWWKRHDLLLGPVFIDLRKDPRFRALAEKAPL